MRASLLILFVVLAGCMQQVAKSNPSSSGNSEMEGLQKMLATQGTNSIPNNATFTDCQSVSDLFTFWAQTGPGKPPGNWTKTEGPGTDIHTYAIDCNRVSWGPFERPLTFIIDTHNNFVSPGGHACREGRFNYMEIVGHFLVNDKEVATWLNATYGLPSAFATIDVKSGNTSGLASLEFDWAVPGGSTSKLSAYEYETSDHYVFDLVTRLAWQRGNGIGLFDYYQYPVKSNYQPVITPGEQYAPMLYAESGLHQYVGQGDLSLHGRYDGKIQLFQDFACKQPS